MKKIIISLIAASFILLAAFVATKNANASNGNGGWNWPGNHFGFMKNLSLNLDFKGVKEDFKELKETMKMKVAAHGNIPGIRMVAGSVITVDGSTLKVSIKNQEYTVNTGTDDIIVNRVWDRINLTDIQPGHRVKVFGSVTEKIIDAKLVIDTSLPNIQEKTLVGKVSSIEGNALKLTVGSKEYTANTDSSDIIVDRVWDKISLADIKIGDQVMVFGQASGTAIEAKLIRDLSVPQASATNNDD